jgi:hypothetical protein
MGAPPGTSPQDRNLQVGGFWLGAVVMAVAFLFAFATEEFETPVAAYVIVAVGLAAALVMTTKRTSRPVGQGMLLGLLTILGLVFVVVMAANW